MASSVPGRGSCLDRGDHLDVRSRALGGARHGGRLLPVGRSQGRSHLSGPPLAAAQLRRLRGRGRPGMDRVARSGRRVRRHVLLGPHGAAHRDDDGRCSAAPARLTGPARAASQPAPRPPVVHRPGAAQPCAGVALPAGGGLADLRRGPARHALLALLRLRTPAPGRPPVGRAPCVSLRGADLLLPAHAGQPRPASRSVRPARTLALLDDVPRDDDRVLHLRLAFRDVSVLRPFAATVRSVADRRSATGRRVDVGRQHAHRLGVGRHGRGRVAPQRGPRGPTRRPADVAGPLAGSCRRDRPPGRARTRGLVLGGRAATPRDPGRRDRRLRGGDVDRMVPCARRARPGLGVLLRVAAVRAHGHLRVVEARPRRRRPSPAHPRPPHGGHGGGHCGGHCDR